MSSLLCLVFLWPSGTGYWGGVSCPCARHSPRLIEKVSFNSRLLLASHPLQLVLPFVRAFTGQIYCIRIK